MKIRPARLSDYEDLMKLYNIFVGEDRYSQFDNDSFKKVLASKNNFVFVVESDAELVGFASFSIRYVIRYKKPIAELDELFVIKEYRKHGIGKILMEAVHNKAKELDCYRLYIESNYQHKSGHAFYEKLGYINYGYHFIKNL